MNPTALVEANVAFQKLNEDISDLALVERARKLDTLVSHLDHKAHLEFLEVAREMAIKEKTAQIRDLRDKLTAAGIEIGEDFIDKRLNECRAAAQRQDEANLPKNVSPIWGGTRERATYNV